MARRSIAVAVAVGVLGVTLLDVAAPASAVSHRRAVVVVGEDAAATAAAVHSAGGHVRSTLEAIGGIVAADVTTLQAARLEAAGLDVVADAPARVTSDGFAAGDGVVDGMRVQVAALHPAAGWGESAGAGVGIALIDTGVSPSPELDGAVVAGPDLSGDDDGIDHYGHGTFMAGLIAGRTTGVAPGAHVVSVKVAGADGSTSLSTVLTAIDWAITYRDAYDLRVLSISLAADAAPAWAADPLAIAAEAASRHGLLVVAAAGNDGTEVASPGIAPSALTVGATDVHDTATVADDTVPSWSGRDGAKPELVAPGVSVVSARAAGSTIDRAHPEARVDDDHFRGSGTSMATALTAGAAAVVAEQAPDADAADLKAMLVDGGATLTAADDASTANTAAVDIAAAQAVAVDTDDSPAAAHRKGHVLHGRFGTATWTGTRWAGTRWAGTRWAGTRWAGTRWAGTRWAGTRWAGTRWAGTRWAGTRWAGTRWAGTRWASADLASTAASSP
jgi:serine protease AprX